MMRKDRRKFLKKVYKAPALILLGQFVKPVYADGTGGPEGPPGDFFLMTGSSNKRKRPQRTK